MLGLVQKDIAFTPRDAVTYCMDFFELITGGRGTPPDKSQRVAIVALREDRVQHRIRSLLHVPARISLAHGVTKEGWFGQLLLMAPQANDQAVRHKRAVQHPEATEKEIDNLKEC
eukprot:9253767-Pyramimonas_sp.AAC.1